MAYLRSELIYNRQRFILLGHLISLIFVICQGCAQSPPPPIAEIPAIQPGAWDTEAYLPLFEGKRVGLVINQASYLDDRRLVDTLLSLGVNIVSLFTPEHGLKGTADRGAHIHDQVDEITGIKVFSLHGKNKKPAAEQVQDLDVFVFDMQDVGVRFFTYISTLQYVMEAAAENDVPVIVLDRPNPNGHYIDGPVLDTANFKSFVGLFPIPVVYGMTIGELAKMSLGEGWLKLDCDLTVIPCRYYDHTMSYTLPIKPSPNLPDLRSVLLYPGLCFFEGTPFSLGRGTPTPFQMVGHPDITDHSFSFTPRSVPGASKPVLEGQVCYGLDLRETNLDSLFSNQQLDLSVLLHFYNQFDKEKFFNTVWFDKLAGNSSFREAIQDGRGEADIRASWQEDLNAFNEKRKKYLLYKDFD